VIGIRGGEGMTRQWKKAAEGGAHRWWGKQRGVEQRWGKQHGVEQRGGGRPRVAPRDKKVGVSCGEGVLLDQ
jgi:hypothetical protein